MPHQQSLEFPDTYCSPLSGSCLTEDVSNYKHKLKELENVMLGPDSDLLDHDLDHYTLPNFINSPEIESWRQIIQSIPLPIGKGGEGGDIKKVLIACAKAISDNDTLTAEWLISELKQMVSVSGEPIQRLGAYMLEGLIARLYSSTTFIYNPPSFDLLSYINILFEICPYLKFGYMSANGAIAEAMKNQNVVHIIDFQIAQGDQWVSLIQAFAARPGGPPYIRITGLDDSVSAYVRGGGLEIVGHKLYKLAKFFNVPFEFFAINISSSEIQLKDFDIRQGEALAVNFAFMLHNLGDESVSTENENHRDKLLRLVKRLNPKVVTLVEQECNTNTSSFYPRFLETLDYYKAMFESIEVTLPRNHKERINVEMHCLAKDVVNIVACEGKERVKRHELLAKWKLRFKMAGFNPYPLSCLVNSTIKTLLKNYSDEYCLEERDGALYLGWMNKDLVSSCAWN